MGNSKSGPSFLKNFAAVTQSATPEALFGDLPKLPTGVPALWSHQADQLRTYYDRHRSAANVALELPTGSGKTLVGLLIAEWKRRTLRQRVVYACPTVQLASQVAKAGQDQGIPVSLLTGPSADWDARTFQRYVAGEHIAVTTYSHIFNTHPRFDDAHTLIFDDAHAAENYVAEAWSVAIQQQEATYAAFLSVVAESLDPQLIARLLQERDGGGRFTADIRLIPAAVIDHHAVSIEATLAEGLKDRRRHAFSWLRDNLTACNFYLSGRSLYIRPLIPPASSHAPFTEPEQRLYLSATLGAAGELERSFGVARIQRVPVPDEWSRSGSGRRFFVFPDLADFADDSGHDVTSLTVAAVNRASKRLILTPSQAEADALAQQLGLAEGERFDVRQGNDFSSFCDASRGALLAPNRYDGMDLAGDACRMMLMQNLPSASHPQDQFLDSRLRAKEVLAERVRTRVVQGFGRCTRGPRDYSVVVVAGDELVNYLSRTENLEALPVELQAELAFGKMASQNSPEDLLSLIDSALNQDMLWQTEAEPAISSLRATYSKVQTESSSRLGRTAQNEVLALQAAWSRSWERAGQYAQNIQESIIELPLKPYRALWAYLGASWFALENAREESGLKLKAEALMREAQAASAGTTWLRETLPAPSNTIIKEEIDEGACEAICALLTGRFQKLGKYDTSLARMMAGLADSEATGYEAALVQLGEFLGANSYKPAFSGRTDAVWQWPKVWMTIEAKSEQKSAGVISMEYIRQTNTQLDSLASDFGAERIPPLSFSLIVSPKLVVQPEAVPIAQDHVFLATPANIFVLAVDVDQAWRRLRSLDVHDEGFHSAVEAIVWQYQLLPSQVRERLTLRRVR